MMYPIKNWVKLKRGYVFGQKTFYSNFHLGLDVIAPKGTPIVAWQDLQVINYKYGKEGGNTILVKCANNKRIFRLMHLLKPVNIGIYKEGKTIAMVGNTGSACRGYHLHIDISKNGKLEIYNRLNFENPEKYFTMINSK
jgi:murein DD-endopeptidase MepM/ murein hydrolase activator NlpD